MNNKTFNMKVEWVEKLIELQKQNNGGELTEEIIRTTVRKALECFGVVDNTSSTDEIEKITNYMLAEFEISQTIVDEDDFIADEESRSVRWLTDNLEAYRKLWQYWTAYKLMLLNKLGQEETAKIDRASTQILQLAGDPSRPDKWHRRGLVVGEVQSGKTSNYTAVMCKAADIGYRVFIIFAGLTDSLRRQTQNRLYTDFRRARQHPDFPTIEDDFNRAKADALNLDLSRPTVLVVKKNKTIINNLSKWLLKIKARNAQFKDVPLMLIDDEADNASVNTNKKEKDATAINKGIRELLRIFDKSTYIGCTATPFANIFIDCDKEDEKDDDLFPRNYIYYIKPPVAYIGAAKIFLAEDGKNLIEINDCGEDSTKPDEPDDRRPRYLYVKHLKSFIVEALPQSLQDAVGLFILVCAIKSIQGVPEKHNSMLINVSRFNAVQKQVAHLVRDLVQEISDDIEVNGGLQVEQQHSPLAKLHALYDEHYAADAQLAWSTVKAQLIKTVNHTIAVELVNQTKAKRGQKVLDYDAHPDGYAVIAVGGLSLSRGLTLEGLSISYVLRNTLMYDALLQMARWFGYRKGYDQYCRIFLTPKAIDWYSFVAEAVIELYGEFKSMQEQGLTPLEYGLKVRKHPDNLLITALSKMRNSEQVKVKGNLWGSTVETYDVYADGEKKEQNLNEVRNFVAELLHVCGQPSADLSSTKGYLWRKVPLSLVRSFIENFRATGYALSTQTAALRNFMQTLEKHYGYIDANVALISKAGSSRNLRTKVSIADNIEVYCAQRTFSSVRDKTVKILNRRIVSGIKAAEELERGNDNSLYSEVTIDFTPEELAQLSAAKTERTGIYQRISAVRKRPLLLIYLLDLKSKEDVKQGKTDIVYRNVPSFVLCFPQGNSNSDKDDVIYVVNKLCYEQYLEEEGAGDGDE